MFEIFKFAKFLFLRNMTEKVVSGVLERKNEANDILFFNHFHFFDNKQLNCFQTCSQQCFALKDKTWKRPQFLRRISK
jgi:hypothetical protein